ncbi:hypothetical protein LTR70_003287 [Exophiala xenobiotica]|nr:hypothetical protein LTR70_003287 [Exophiala xenobiotica]
MRAAERNKRVKRGATTDAGVASVVVALAAEGRSLRDINNTYHVAPSTSSGIISRAKRRKIEEIESLGLVVTEEEQENLLPIEYRFTAADPRPQGLSRVMTPEEVNTMLKHATASKAQRYKSWPLIAQECGFGYISDKTIYNYFHEAGYVRAKPKKKPPLSGEQRRVELAQTTMSSPERNGHLG